MDYLDLTVLYINNILQSVHFIQNSKCRYYAAVKDTISIIKL